MKIPENILNELKNRQGPAVFATVSADSVPNVVYVGYCEDFDGERLVLADNYFCKTRENIENCKNASVLFINKDFKSFQIKGTLEYHTNGPIFDFMKSWNPSRHPGVAGVALLVDSIYSGSEKLL